MVQNDGSIESSALLALLDFEIPTGDYVQLMGTINFFSYIQSSDQELTDSIEAYLDEHEAVDLEQAYVHRLWTVVWEGWHYQAASSGTAGLSTISIDGDVYIDTGTNWVTTLMYPCLRPIRR